MELQYYGANCLVISTKQARIVVDDNLSQVGLKTITKADDILLRTSNLAPELPARFVASMPGEYEISGVTITGVAARAHMDPEDKKTAVMYVVAVAELRVLVVGHIFPELDEKQLEKIAGSDIAIVPIGNSGYTLDGVGALKVIKEIEPKVVIPTHYADKAIKYEVSQSELTEGLKSLSMEPAQTLDKYRPKLAELTDTTQLVVLSRQ